MTTKPEPLSVEEVAAIHGMLDASGAEERPWCWTWTGDKSNDWAIGTACLLNDESNEPALLSGHIEDVENFCALEEVCRAENSGYDDANLIVTAVNSLPRLLATIADLQARALDEDLVRGIADAIYEMDFVCVPREWRDGPIDPEIKIKRLIGQAFAEAIARRRTA